MSDFSSKFGNRKGDIWELWKGALYGERRLPFFHECGSIRHRRHRLKEPHPPLSLSLSLSSCGRMHWGQWMTKSLSLFLSPPPSFSPSSIETGTFFWPKAAIYRFPSLFFFHRPLFLLIFDFHLLSSYLNEWPSGQKDHYFLIRLDWRISAQRNLFLPCCLESSRLQSLLILQ